MSAPFVRPINVLVGLGSLRRIEHAGQALEFLLEQPLAARDEAFDATVSACRDALAGLVDAEDAYDIVSAYARRRDMYLEDAVVDPQPVELERQLAA